MKADVVLAEMSSIEGHVDESSHISVLRESISGLALNLEAPFVAAGSMLIEVVEALDRIIAEIEVVSRAIDRSAARKSVSDLKKVADRLMALPDIHAARTSQMNIVADVAKELNSGISATGRTLRLLDIFGMNIGVASEGEPEFTGFVRDMSEKLVEGERALAGMASQLSKMLEGVAGMQSADRELLIESTLVIPQVPRQLIRDSTLLGEHLEASAVAAEKVADSARRVRDQVAVILGAMQVGDRTRQRLEHIAAGLDMAVDCRKKGAAPAASAHFERLLCAHIEAAAADFHSEANLLTDAFSALRPETQQLLELMEESTGDGGSGTIVEMENGIGEVIRLTGRVCTADNRANAMRDLIAAAIADLGQRLDGVRRLRSNVQVIATNIALICRRHGQIGRGVSAIADQIDVQATALPQLTENIARPIVALTSVSEAMQSDQATADAVDANAILCEAMDILREGMRRSEAAAQNRRGGDGRRVIEILEKAANAIEPKWASQIHDCAGMLVARSTSDSDPSDSDLAHLLPALQRLGSIYTMSQERQIHARFMPPGAEPLSTAVAVPDADDDGLF